MEKLINGRLVSFSRVVSVIPSGKKQVFDLEVEKDHNYYANGISVHNCDYYKMLDHYGAQYGKEFYRSSTLYRRFFHRNLDYYPMGPTKRTLRGDTRIITATDELGLFPFKIANNDDLDEDDDAEFEDTAEDDERERANGDEVHQSLDNSLATVRAEIWSLYKQDISSIPTGMNLNLSSPYSWKDKICRLLKESEDPATLSLGLRLPTWEINPIFTRDHPIITAAYARNARRAERDYGANPPKLSATMFKREPLQKAFCRDNHYAVVYDEDNPDHTLGRLKEIVLKNRWPASVMGLDAGLNNNSFAISIGNRVESSVEATTTLELIPSKKKPIHYPTLYKNILLPLVQKCNVVYAGADRWNSIQLLQQLEEDTKGRCRWIQIKLNMKHFEYFKELTNSGNLFLPKIEWSFDGIESVVNYKRELKGLPAEHLYLQFLTVKEHLQNVVKGEGNTDDLWRALAMMVTMQFTPKIREYVIECKDLERTDMSHRATVLVSGRSGLRMF